MFRSSLICAFLFLSPIAQAESAQIVKFSGAIELKVIQADIEVESSIEKLSNYLTPCLPAVQTQKQVYDQLLENDKIVEVQKFQFLNAAEVLKDCPDRGTFKVRVRYLSKE
jgi:hypothetical protein